MKKIFLIEDDPFICDIVQTKFKNTDFCIEFALTAEKGLEEIEENMPDLLLLDLGLPDIPGTEVLKKLKHNPKFANLPIVIFTNRTDAEIQNEVNNLGADGFFSKDSIDADKLIKQLSKVLFDDTKT